MGAALAHLRSQGVLLLASGMSFHNMAQFARSGGAARAGLAAAGQVRWAFLGHQQVRAHACIPAHARSLPPVAHTPTPPLQAFNQWLLQACTAEPAQRRQLLGDWASAPGAREAHPREEHLLPLMVAAGAADAAATAEAAAAARAGDSPAAADGGGGSGSSSGCTDASGDTQGVVLWDGECMGAAVAAIGFGRFLA